MEASRKKFGLLLVRMLIGGVVGFAAMKFGLESGLGLLLRGAGPGAAALAGFGLIFVLMGLFVGLGAALPGLGAKVLNVSGREDIEDQRAMFGGSAVSCLTLGIGMTLLALAAPNGPVPTIVGLAAFVFALFLSAAITLLQWPRYDELWRRLTLEGTAWGGSLLAMSLLVWGALAIVEFAALPDPAGLVALVMGLNLLGCFVAIGRRGMLLQP
jgi:hypothetical protein